jgi:hypothetical protein
MRMQFHRRKSHFPLFEDPHSLKIARRGIPFGKQETSKARKE